jgi:hypothetical protein
METIADGAVDDAVVGLIVDDGAGHFFAIASDDLIRFRVPESYRGVVAALVLGGEAPAGQAGVRGSERGNPSSGQHALLDEVVIGAVAARGRLAARRLSVWVLLR